MAQIIGLPKLSPTMEEGVLVRWTKKEGDKVSPGDLVAEVETDKANMDFNIEDDGVLLKLLVKEGETVKLGAPVAILGKAGEDVSALIEQAKSGGGGAPKAAEPKAAPKETMGAEDSANAPAAQKGKQSSEQKPEAKSQAPKAEQKPAPKAAPKSSADATTMASSKPEGGKLLASPLAKTLAIELGIDLRGVKGSGPGGRIVERDVRQAADGHATQAHNGHATDEAETTDVESETQPTAIALRKPLRQDVGDDDFEDLPASNMRKRIAARLTEAKRDVPHFYLMRKLDAAPLLGFRARLNELLGDRGKVSVNDLIIKAVALALRRVPECNASWEGDAIRRYHRVHVGVAVAIEDGLVTPVVRDADQKGIGAIAAEVKDLAERAKKRGLKGHEITGSTFTVSNLGMMGIERFTAIINPPEGGILAVGATVDEPVIQGDKVVPGKRMTVTMSCDHRVIDGALGAKWLQAFAELFEKPESLAL
ncbi:MAG: pyruvate dehydrogenase complex dihydrolipoamide acetyltransferase [Myxococcota bacterium]|nr:pyruvate dehydrogenase complex dihydrolipoamide acetyltransferase [Myxococcota bacterium]